MKESFIGFKSCYHAEVIGADTVILLNDLGEGVKLVGKSYVLLAKHLQEGQKTASEIVSLLEDLIPKAEAYHALLRLQEKKIVEEKAPLSNEVSAFCQLLGLSSEVAYKRLCQTSISVHTLGQLRTDHFVENCLKIGIKIDEKSDISVVFTDNYRNQELSSFHKQSLQSNQPWLLVRPFGPECWLGPLLLPQKTACWECLLHALKNYRIEETLIEELQQKKGPISFHQADLPFARGFAINWAVSEVLKWIVQGFHEGLENKITTFNFCTSTSACHTVIKRAHCPSCGTLPPKEPKTLTLEKDFPSISHEEIYKTYSHLISPITGMVAFMKKIENSSSVLHNYFAGFNLADLEFVRRFPIGKAVATASGGKGMNDAQAKASCLCEAIERYSGVYHGHEIKKEATFQELGCLAILPNDILLFSDQQYQTRELWNRSCHRFHYIPRRFDETKKIEWTPVWSLIQKDWKWVPTALCYFSYNLQKEAFCRADSNGCAAGNTKAEAILSAFFELVERDSVALWWYNRVQRPQVKLEYFSEPYIEKLKAQYALQGRNFWVLDLTSDLKIPVFAAISADFSGEKILFGFGSHFDPKIALFRALTEMNQFYNVCYWQEGKMADANRKKWFESANLANNSYLIPSSQEFQEIYYEKQNPNELISRACEIVQKKGMDFLVLDQTHPDIGMPVFRVMIPGLRHFWNRYGPGRLYDVPIELGWLKKKNKESELNPIPIFI